MKNWKTLKKELLRNKKVLQEYKKLEPRYLLISKLIEARIKKGLTQKDLAERIGTKQTAIARLESDKSNPTILFLEKIVRGLGMRLSIRIE
ncbi:helix-turn-helix transcriptional regulator [Candidatus Gottesmanbacteria bacterium]|nr:helix-turn-helix transcriptional regulator [Candidatus Gottesmanbacteria bacterium]